MPTRSSSLQRLKLFPSAKGRPSERSSPPMPITRRSSTPSTVLSSPSIRPRVFCVCNRTFPPPLLSTLSLSPPLTMDRRVDLLEPCVPLFHSNFDYDQCHCGEQTIAIILKSYLWIECVLLRRQCKWFECHGVGDRG